jgi:hypothetical protein
MAHVRKDSTLAPKINTWNKHLRPEGKRNLWKRERAKIRKENRDFSG